MQKSKLIGEQAGFIIANIPRNALVETLFDTKGPVTEPDLLNRAMRLLASRRRKAKRNEFREQLERLKSAGFLEPVEMGGEPGYQLSTTGHSAAVMAYNPPRL